MLVAGVLGAGVLAAACGTPAPPKVTAGGTAGAAKPAAVASPAVKPVDLAAPAAAPDDAPRADPAVGDVVKVGGDGGSVAVTAVEDNVSAGRLFGAGDGQKYVAAEVKGCSGPHEKGLTFEPAYFLLKLNDGTMHDHGPGAKKPELEGGTVPAGKCLSGWVTFTVPEDTYPTAVLYDGSSRLTWTVAPPKGVKATTTTTARASGVPTTTTTGKAPAVSSTTTPTTRKTQVASTTTTATASTTTTAKATTTTTAKATTATTDTTATTADTPATTG
jgi:hypothetical protein